MKYRLLVCVIALAALVCALGGTAFSEGQLSIVCTDFPCFDFARQVVGDLGSVTMLIHPGVEVHSFEPTPSDILSIGQADLFVYIGGESDAWADDILSGFDDEGPARLRMMDAVELLLEEEGEAEEHDGPEYDEHIWTSPKNAAAMVRALADALCELDAADAEEYGRQATEYIRQIDAIDADFRAVVESGTRREMIFADRFPFLYFARAYGLDYTAAFPSCTSDTEPTPQILLSLIQKVERDGIPVVYAIELSTQAVAKTVAEETGARILTMHSMQTVTQAEFDAGESYVSLMRRNVEALREGLN